MIEYTYRNLLVRTLVQIYDKVGSLIYHPYFKPSKSPERICLIILHQIGDMVMTIPSITAVKKMFPNAKITILAGRAPAKLLESLELDLEVIVFNAMWEKAVQRFEGKRNNIGTRRLIAILKDLNPTVCLIFNPDLRVNYATAKARIPGRIGFANAGGGFWLTTSIILPRQGHQVKRNFSLIASLADHYSILPPAIDPPQLILKKGYLEKVEQLLNKEKIGKKKIIVLHPFTEESKMWPEHNWQRVIEAIDHNANKVFVIGAPTDHFSFTGGYHNLCGKLSLGETAALLSKADLFIGIDSGPGHIAAAMDCSVISIFSSVNDPKRFAPWGRKVEVLYREVADRLKFPVRARTIPKGVIGNPYIDQITPGEVLKSIAEHLNAD